MDSATNLLIQDLLRNKFCRLYLEAKLGKTPGPEDLYNTIEGPEGADRIPSPMLGALSHFINWFEKEHKKDSRSRFVILINKIKNLSESPEGRVKIIDVMLSFPSMMKAEDSRKLNYKKVYKGESQKYDRAKKKALQQYEEGIGKIKELDPELNEDRYRTLAKKKAENIQPSLALQQIRDRQKYGLMGGYTQPKKSTKGSEMLKRFLYSLYSVPREHSSLTPNKIYVEIAKILDLLKVKNQQGKKHTAKNIEGIIKRYIAFLQKDPALKVIQ